MASRHEDWLRQAGRDLQMAEGAREAGIHEWACFGAQQAAEKAVKALLQKRAAEAWGHSVTYLLQALPEGDRPGGELLDQARNLDKHYVPARYPNGFDVGAPMDYFTEAEACRAIENARAILDHCKGRLSR
jgi:HEPN domain-containing protein